MAKKKPKAIAITKTILRISCINVGYGDAILFELFRDELPPFIILLDCGGNESEEFVHDSSRIRAGDYLVRASIEWIDLLICSHVHEDHVCGFAHKIDHLID